jgi:glycopeptide antibiotics resistance protein
MMVAAAFIYGILIEFLQRWLTSTRSFELLDILFNLAGIVLATLFYYLFIRRFYTRTGGGN